MEEREILKVAETDVVQDQLKKKGIANSKVISQIKRFIEGFPFMELSRVCTIGDGIHMFGQRRKDELIKRYLNLHTGIRTVKFVPASGAASRMFRDLVSEYNLLKQNKKADLKKLPATLELVKNLEKFAFSQILEKNLKEQGHDIGELVSDRDYLPILSTLLDENRMNYSNIPKGLVQFHRYGSRSRTAFEEHLVEAISYLFADDGSVSVHFTVPEQFIKEIKNVVDRNKEKYETEKIKITAGYSVQKESTDTIAVDKDNYPVVDNEGKLVFRPGGHGALLENLNEMEADIVFIKNIDNILVEKYLDTVSRYKMMLGGFLLEIQQKVFNFIRRLEDQNHDEDLFSDIKKFLKHYLFTDMDQLLKDKTGEEKVSFFYNFLNRPIRVCGVVKNEGEPGGGPFWVKGDNGFETPQIVESAQVNMDDQKQLSIWESSTHFNPVDIVCGIKDHKGNKFDLMSFVDTKAGIITNKSLEGSEIKALELPGLWNGSMSDWITLFTEVPVKTFSPVKTVFDLLREEHQGN